MKRAVIITVLMYAATAIAQIHGVPASVTSQTIGRSTPGVPASVTSLGPNGFDGVSQFGFAPLLPSTTFTCGGGGLVCGPTTMPPIHTGRGHHRWGNSVYVPYYYPAYPMVYSEGDAMPPYAQPEPEAPAEPEPPAPTVFERRPTSRPYARDEMRYDRDLASKEPETLASKSVEIGVGEQETTTLIFRDGHHMDIHNYAIVGHTLFNFDGTGPFKVLLAELDLAATEKLNGDRGVDFKLPVR